MVRAAELGRVKRRLGKGIGALAALVFYRRTAAALLRRLGLDRRWRLWIAVTPDAYARAGQAIPGELGGRSAGGPRSPRATRIPQGVGDLGARMGRTFACLPPGPVVIVGSDIPGVTAAHIARAFAALRRCDAVFGPAGDGGYWLIGLRRSPRTPDLFRNVRWSSPHALEDTLANLGPSQRAALIDTLEDVDDADAYRRWRARERKRGAGTRPGPA
jgi:glycosyltransferase A (GT-A) superfamily protein (DUF2064 family)